MNRITVLGKGPAPELHALAQYRPCIVCDLYIEGIETAPVQLPWGFRDGDLENIDHHAPQPRFETDVTSTELAIARVRAEGIAPAGTKVVINHTDCDSILSSGIVSGLLQPLDRYRVAALAADHTGDENAIADLLQGMDDDWVHDALAPVIPSEPRSGESREAGAQSMDLSAARLEFALSSLLALESGAPLPPIAQQIVTCRTEARTAARAIVKGGRFNLVNGVAWAELSAKIDGELFIPLLPAAEVVVIGFRNDQDPERWTIKARLGKGRRPDVSLQRMGIETFDPNWGGRWDAGSNTRVSMGTIPGTTRTVEDWVNRLAQRTTF